MAAYILRRLLLMIPTIFGIMAISFAIVQFAPGGPVERIIAQLHGHDVAPRHGFLPSMTPCRNRQRRRQ